MTTYAKTMLVDLIYSGNEICGLCRAKHLCGFNCVLYRDGETLEDVMKNMGVTESDIVDFYWS